MNVFERDSSWIRAWIRAGFELDSSGIRAGFELDSSLDSTNFDLFNPIQRYVFFDTVFDISRIDSNPVRSVRMQWSKTYQMVVPYVPDGN